MFVVLLSGADPAGGGGESGGLMDVFKKNPTFLSINLVVSASSSRWSSSGQPSSSGSTA